MRLYKQYMRVYWKNKLLVISLAGFIGFCFYELLTMYFSWPDNIVTPLEVTLKLSTYVFIFFLPVSYWFFAKGKWVYMEECAAVTSCGKRSRHYLAQFCVVFTGILILAVLLILYNVTVFEITIDKYGRDGIGFDYIQHICKCIFVYIVLIAVLSTVIGANLSRISSRMISYGVMLGIIFISGAYMERIVNIVMDSIGINLFEIRNYFDIFPINLSFIPNPGFGFSVLLYKIAIIVFWIAAFCGMGVFFFKLRKKAVYTALAAVVCIGTLAIYSMPASKVIMDNSPQGSAMHDMFYYDCRTDLKEKEADFRIEKYDLDFKIGNQLTASAEMKLSETDLKQYDFTIYHGYQVTSVKNQDGEDLKFHRETDYLSVYRGDRPIKKLTVSYKGAASAYYSNWQGMYLPGDFQYYPIAGFLKLADTEGGRLNRQFLKEETDFDVEVDHGREVFSNLKKTGENHFVGKSNGVSLMSGMMSELSDGNNKVIYPTYKDHLQADYDNTLRLLKKSGYEGCTVVIIPNMNQTFDTIVSERQITTQIPFYIGETGALQQEWLDLLEAGKAGTGDENY